MTKFYVDNAGHYLGGFDGAEPPEGAIEVAAPPTEARMVWDGERFVAPTAPPVLQGVPDYVAAVQAMLDGKVLERRYYNIMSACTYATCMAWRDAVWAKAYEVLDQVQAGVIPQPSIEELLNMLPAMTWPA
jgi:hypothetical protein